MLVARSGVAVSWIAATRKVAARITRSGSVDLVNLDQLPVRSDGSLRPAGLTLPPARMPLIHDRRPLKRWTYVGIYGEELMLCAASVRVGGIPQCFWAVLDRASGEMIEQTAFSSRIVAVDDGHLSVSSRKAKIELALRPSGEPVEVVSRHGASYIWTRKLPVVASGTVIAGGREQRIECAGPDRRDRRLPRARNLMELVGRSWDRRRRQRAGLEHRQRRSRRAHQQRANGLG